MIEDSKESEDETETAMAKWYASTTFFMTKRVYKSCKYFTQHTGRLIEVCFKTNLSIDLLIINNYTPHNTRDTAERVRHFETLKK